MVLNLTFAIVTMLIMFSGMPIMYSLGLVSTIFMILFMPHASLDTVAQNVYEEVARLSLLALTLFILKGEMIGKSPLGKDLYTAANVWGNKIPGGLGIVSVVACALFASMSGSSPATCAAIGPAAIPEMRKRGYSGGFATGLIAAGGTLGILLPPSITMILYAIVAEQSLGKLFLAGIGPAFLLVGLFSIYSIFHAIREHKHIDINMDEDNVSLKEKLRLLPRVLPFVILLTAVMFTLYGGYATPAETAGIGAFIGFILLIIIYRLWRPRDLQPILSSAIKDSTMLIMIVGMSLLFSYVMSSLQISQSAAHWIVGLHLDRWSLLATVLFFVIILGFFLPPISIIVMILPIILPALRAEKFDLIWFGIVMTIVMEMGLIHPPVGLNIFVIKNIAPDIPISEIIYGIIPFIILMFIAILIICICPGIATWLPYYLIN